MTLNKPTIILSRLVIARGSQIVYDQSFHTGLNVIYGENTFGKTCIMDMIFYALGGCITDSEWKEEIKQCSAVYAEVEFNEEIFTLKRNISNPPSGRTSMSLHEGNMVSAISSNEGSWKTYNYSSTENKDSFSNILFTILGIPEVKTVEIEHSITINSCLRLMYFDQRTPYFEIFRNEQFDNDTKRKVIGDLMCGIYNANYYLYNSELKTVEAEHKRITDYLKSAFSILNSDEKINTPEFFENILENQNSQLSSKIEEYQALKQDFYKDTLKKSNKKELDSLVTNIERTNTEIEKLTDSIIKAEYESSDSEEFIKYLEFKLSKLEDSEMTSQYLDSLDIHFCPVCYSKIAPSEDEKSCYLCKSNTEETSRKVNLAKLKRNLLSQIQESNKIQIERLEFISNAKNELKALQARKTRYQKDFALKNDTISSNEVSFMKINEDIGYIRKEIEETEKKIKLSKRLKGYIDDKERLNTRRSWLIEQITNIDMENATKIAQAQTLIADTMKSLLAQDVGGDDDLKEIKTVEVNFEKNRLFVDDRSNYAASSMSYIKSCFSLALWVSSLENSNFNFPRFCLIDSIEDKGLEPKRIHRFQENIRDICEKADIKSQIIISASNLREDLQSSKFMVGPYYHGDEKRNKTLNFASTVKISDLIPEEETATASPYTNA